MQGTDSVILFVLIEDLLPTGAIQRLLQNGLLAADAIDSANEETIKSLIYPVCLLLCQLLGCYNVSIRPGLAEMQETIKNIKHCPLINMFESFLSIVWLCIHTVSLSGGVLHAKG